MFIDYGRLRKARRAAHLTTRAVAQKLGVNKSTISRYENQDTKLPLEMFLQMIALYGIGLNDVLIGGGETNVKEN